MVHDEDRSSFRYHDLIRQLLRAELRARDPGREQELQLRAAEWFESTGDTWRATRHFLAARQVDRALALLQDRVVADFLHDPALPAPLDLAAVDSSRWPAWRWSGATWTRPSSSPSRCCR